MYVAMALFPSAAKNASAPEVLDVLQNVHVLRLDLEVLLDPREVQRDEVLLVHYIGQWVGEKNVDPMSQIVTHNVRALREREDDVEDEGDDVWGDPYRPLSESGLWLGGEPGGGVRIFISHVEELVVHN